ncbi:MAG: DUF2934 domain-containing protein [Sulfuritalea sp.]|nr:DUF2934 domain-containing protein [Sulfuritalea sp.]MBK8118443.1 DUF2934 domain-containing protein [Sulfuritalea sp.]
MIFSLLTFASAFLIEGLGTWISIIGLSSLFSADPIIIALAAALDLGKVVTVSFLYKRWSTAPGLLRIYMILAVAVLMLITSVGAFGYLSAAFQGAIKDTKQQQILVAATVDEKARLEARKKEIDAQIAGLPSNNVRGRQRLISAFKGEADRINLRLRQLDAELPKMQMQQVTINTHAGPIIYVSQAFDVSVEQAVKYVILVIIFVFDPLAIALLVAGNFLWETRAQRPRAPLDAAVRTDKEVKQRQEPPDELASAASEAVPSESAKAVDVPIPRDEAPQSRTPIHAEVRPPAGLHLATSADLDEQPTVQPPNAVRAAGADPEAAEIPVNSTGTANQQAPVIVNPEQAIRDTAYYLAEQRKFKDGVPADDWVRAEQEIKKILNTS